MPIPKTMRAMVLEQPGQPLKWLEVPVPTPGPEQVLIRVHACGVCRTDLHVVDGELPQPKLPLIPGHEIVGTVAATGSAVRQFQARRARRGALAGLDLRPVPLLPQRPGEPLRHRPLHRLHHRRRLRRIRRGRRALLLPPAGGLRRR